MLSSALSEMIDKTECIIFFNTPESIILKDELDKNKAHTYSQWIYYELSMTKMIKTTKPARLKSIKVADERLAHHSIFESLDDKDFGVDYGVDYGVEKFLEDMDDLDDRKLETWINIHNKNKCGECALDELYSICKVK